MENWLIATITGVVLVLLVAAVVWQATRPSKRLVVFAGMDLNQHGKTYMAVLYPKRRGWEFLTLYIWRTSEMTWPTFIKKVTMAWRVWGIKRVLVDATAAAGDLQIQMLQDSGVPAMPFYYTKSNRDYITARLKKALEGNQIRFGLRHKYLRDHCLDQPMSDQAQALAMALEATEQVRRGA